MSLLPRGQRAGGWPGREADPMALWGGWQTQRLLELKEGKGEHGSLRSLALTPKDGGQLQKQIEIPPEKGQAMLQAIKTVPCGQGLPGGGRADLGHADLS